MENVSMSVEEIYDGLEALCETGLTIDTISKYFNETAGMNESIKQTVLERLEDHKGCIKESIEQAKEEGEEFEYPIVLSPYGGNRTLECECCYTVILDEEIAEMMIAIED